MPSDTVTLNLTPDEILVLYGIVMRYSNSDKLEVRDFSEQVVLWNLDCMLEKHDAVDPMDEGYESRLEAAQKRLRASHGGKPI